MREKLTIDKRVIYFDIIKQFGLHENNNPLLARTDALSISLRLAGHGKCTAYGNTVEEVCERAYAWLKPLGWKSESETLYEVLYRLPEMVENMMRQRGAEVVMPHSNQTNK